MNLHLQFERKYEIQKHKDYLDERALNNRGYASAAHVSEP